MHRAKALCDKEILHEELVFLKTTLREMGKVTNRYDGPSTWWLDCLS